MNTDEESEARTDMEIERKWMVDGWPDENALPLLRTEYQEQGYLHTQAPVVRIRLEGQAGLTDLAQASSVPGSSPVTDFVKEAVTPENTRYILCIKSAGLLVREEVEVEISKDDFDRLAKLTGHGLIRKVRRVYRLPDQLELEVNLVDEGLPSEFMYAEVEYAEEAQAGSWSPASCSLENYLAEDVTQQRGQSMSAYWAKTRIGHE